MPTAWNNITNIPTAWANSSIPKIAVCIPYNSRWEPEWVEKTYGPLRWKPTNWCNKIVFYCKVPSLPVARDTLVKQALQTNCDYLLFLDNDHVFESPSDPNEALNILYQCMNKDPNSKDGKIVSALYRAKQKQGFNWAMWMKVQDKGFTPVQEWTGNWLEIDVAGLGCCLIDTIVFKNIERPWFRWDDGDGISEDFYFYQLAKRHGYLIRTFTDVRLSHLGELKIKSDGTMVTPDL